MWFLHDFPNSIPSSPNGRQFVSCKEVSSYLLSLSGLKVASQPSAAHTGDCIQLDNKMTFGNVSHPFSYLFYLLQVFVWFPFTSYMLQAVGPTLKDDKNAAEQVFHLPFPAPSVSTEHEKQATLLNIMSPREAEGQENWNKKYSVSNTTNEKLEKMNAATEVNAAKLDVSFDAKAVLYNNQNNKHFGSCSSERDVPKNTISSSNNMSRQDQIFQPHALDSSGNGVYFSSVEKRKQEIGDDSGFLSSNAEDKIFSCQNLEKGLFTSSMEHVKVDVDKCERDEAIAGSVYGCSRLVDTMTYEKGRASFEGCSIVLSGSELKCGSMNAMNKAGRPEDSEDGLLNLFGSEKIFGFDNKLTKVSVDKMEVPKLDEVRNSSEDAHGLKNNYRVDTGMVQESRLEDSDNASNNELMSDLSNHNRSGVDFMTQLLWRTEEENILLSGLTDTSSQLFQSSAFGTMSDKVCGLSVL